MKIENVGNALGGHRDGWRAGFCRRAERECL